MKVLIIFESVEGQTQKITDFVDHQLSATGHAVKVFNTENRTSPIDLEDFDGIVLAAPVHERRHPKAFEVFVSASREDLDKKQTLLLSVSLKAAFPEGQEEAWDYLTEMKMRTGFTPSKEMIVAGAVRTDSYDYFEKQVLNNVVLAGEKSI
ncbi:flavodoxin domain-containing protein [Roseovarius rhodophyticola]|uniref:Flavodoxin domain-containing protein n=1 Tax=Roseovarius rhodophyticola TaxID=3080827 RepID=A0ABZ2THN2_9RHOB|nr:flavodoxin domain-containing protein [Roseovarius sp. W115]MDV2931005.1 flavodoxin domain-containing protein [Roseovarius sp. W115]